MIKKKEEKSVDVLSVPAALLSRVPKYYNYLRKLYEEGKKYVSSSSVAKELDQNSVQVRKDLALLSSVPGKSHLGFVIEQLLKDIELFLGYDNTSEVVLVGVGSLGTALLCHKSLNYTGVEIVMAFDNRRAMQGKSINGKIVMSVGKMQEMIKQFGIKLAIITVPAEAAQSVADKLVSAGIKGILNMAPVHLVVPQDVLVRYSDVSMEMALLAQQVDETMRRED